MTWRTHRMLTQVLALWCVTLIGFAGAVAVSPVASAQDAGAAPGLRLVENSFVVEMNGELFLGYEVLGELEGFVALPPPFEDPEEIDPDLADALATRARFEVVVTSHAPLTQRAEVARVLAGDPGPALDGARIDFDEVVILDEESRPVGFSYAVPTATGGNRAAELEFVREGLYPVSVELWREGSRIARHLTFAERLADPAEPSVRPLAFLISVVAGVSDPGPDPTPAVRAHVVEELTQLRDLAGAVRSGITAIIPPGAAGELTDLPELRAELAEALRGGELAVLPSVRFDPSSAAEAGESPTFVAAMRAGEDLLGVTLPEVPLRRTTWPASARITGDRISRAGASLVRDLGAPLVILSPEVYLGLFGALPRPELDTSVWHVAEAAGGTTITLGLIDPVSRLIHQGRGAASSGGELNPTEVAVQVMAELSAERFERPSGRRGALVSGPDLQVPDPAVMLRVEEMVERHPLLALQTASTMVGAVDAATRDGLLRRVDLPERAGPDVRTRAAALNELADQIEVVSSVLPEEDPRRRIWQESRRAWLSTGYTEQEVATRIEDRRAELAEVIAAVELPERFTFTLTGAASEISLRIHNTSSTTLRVVLQAEATKLAFPELPRLVELAPGITTVDLAVRTLSNGTFEVLVELLTPRGAEPVGEPLRLTARVNALTGLGQVLTGGAVVVLASWWYNHLRRRRRPEEPSPATDEEPATTA